MIINTYNSTTGGTAAGNLTISWKHRNRFSLSIAKQSDPTETLETDATYTVRIYDADGALIRTVTGITDDEYIYDAVDEVADAGHLQKQLTIEIKTVRDGYESVYLTTTHNR